LKKLDDKETKKIKPSLPSADNDDSGNNDDKSKPPTKLPREDDTIILSSRKVQQMAKNDYKTLNWTKPSEDDKDNDMCLLM